MFWCCILQVDEPSLRDVCSEYGALQTCLINLASECALICYSSKEEAIQAKTGLDKNPSICGINVVADFAAETDLGYFYEKEEGNIIPPRVGMSEESTPSWFNEPIRGEMNSETLAAATEEGTAKPSKWDDPSYSSLPMMLPPGVASETSTHVTANSTPTPTSGSSLWGDGSFLSGLASPWRENVNFGTIGQGRGGLGQESGSSNAAAISNSGGSSLSTFLPNGLL